METHESIRFDLPFSQNLPVLLKRCAEIRSLPLAVKYEIDVSEVQHCEPFGLLMLSSAIRAIRARCLADGSPVAVSIMGRSDKRAHGFIESMGFWWAIGEDADRPTGLPPANDRYVRMDRISLSDMQRKEAAGADPMRSGVLSRHAADLATVLAGASSGPTWQALEYCFRELIRNAFEHSMSDGVWVSAWSRFRQDSPDVQVAILDEGRGVRASLSARGKYSPTTDADAVELAVQRGVSSNLGRVWSEERMSRLRDAFPDQDPSVWDNSGYGLYMTSELAKRAGQFAIVSGEASLAYMGSTKVIATANHPGTAVRISLEPGRIESAMKGVFEQVDGSGAAGSHAKRLISVSMMRRLGIQE